MMISSKSELGTLGAMISDKKLYVEQNVVKVVTKENLENSKFPEAINFVRKISKPYKNVYRHLGV